MHGFVLVSEGGPGSGHWGHKGRKGKKGGAIPGIVKRATLVKASNHIDTLIEKLKGNLVFGNIVNGAKNSPLGGAIKGAVRDLYDPMQSAATFAARNSLIQACLDVAKESGWKPEMADKYLTAYAKSGKVHGFVFPQQAAVRSPGDARMGENQFFSNIEAMQAEWATNWRTSGTQITKQGALAQTKGILTPELAFMCAINRQVAKNYYGKSVDIYRGLNRKGPGKYMDSVFKSFPKPARVTSAGEAPGSSGKITTNSVSSWSSSRGAAMRWTHAGGITLSSRVSTSQNLIAYAAWWGRGGCSADEMEVSPISRKYYARRIDMAGG